MRACARCGQCGDTGTTTPQDTLYVCDACSPVLEAFLDGWRARKAQGERLVRLWASPESSVRTAPSDSRPGRRYRSTVGVAASVDPVHPARLQDPFKGSYRVNRPKGAQRFAWRSRSRPARPAAPAHR